MREFAFSPLIRIFHWLRFLSIVTLIASGFYIAWPFLMTPKSSDVLVQGWVRFAHLVFGFIFAGITITRCYLFLFSRDNSERRSLRDALSYDRWVSQIKAYIFLGQPDEKAGLYGPMQLVTYATFYTCSLVMVFTGLALYANVYHEGLGGFLYGFASWLTMICGGLANVRNIHHWFTWVFIVFLFLHVYLAIWTGIRFKKAAVDAIISGYDYHTEHDEDGHEQADTVDSHTDNKS
ncbi:Ni/Fe-hydrogenase, b-type cytochrome subunit [Vibrio sp. S11_S32]|nr:Ni/Fe-hydrogenase, b-type cytochrome subunit [Vibrio sp. S11_S32]